LPGRKRIASSQPCRTFAPWTRLQMSAVEMLVIHDARDESLFCLLEGILPFLSVWTRLWTAVARHETAQKEFPEVRREEVRGRSGRHGAIWPVPLAAVGKMSCGNTRFIGRGVAAALKHSCERMRAFHKQLEKKHRQAKQVVFGFTVELRKGATLEFGRGIFRFTHGAAVHGASLRGTHLKRIGIHKSHECGIRHQNIRLIHIADNVTASVECPHYGSEIMGCAQEVAIVEERTLLPTR
jgi:hypothetical protein